MCVCVCARSVYMCVCACVCVCVSVCLCVCACVRALVCVLDLISVGTLPTYHGEIVATQKGIGQQEIDWKLKRHGKPFPRTVLFEILKD